MADKNEAQKKQELIRRLELIEKLEQLDEPIDKSNSPLEVVGKAAGWGSGMMRTIPLGLADALQAKVRGKPTQLKADLERALKAQAPSTGEYLTRWEVPPPYAQGLGFLGDLLISPSTVRTMRGGALPQSTAGKIAYTIADPLDMTARPVATKASQKYYQSAFKDMDQAAADRSFVTPPSEVAWEHNVGAVTRTGRDRALQRLKDELVNARAQATRPLLDTPVPREAIEAPVRSAAQKVKDTYGLRLPGELAEAEVLSKFPELGQGPMLPNVEKLEEVRKLSGDLATSNAKASRSSLLPDEQRLIAKAKAALYDAQEKASRQAVEGVVEKAQGPAARTQYAKRGKKIQALIEGENVPNPRELTLGRIRDLALPLAGVAGSGYYAARPDMAALSLLLGAGLSTGGKTYGGLLGKRLLAPNTGNLLRQGIDPNISPWGLLSEEEEK
jgi:hypothetical protein